MTNPTTELTRGQIERFHRDGFLALDAITTAAEVEQLRTIYDRLFNNKVGWEQGDQFDLAGTDDGEADLPQLVRPSRYAPELKETEYLRNARSIARQLLGDDMLEANGEHMIYKPAGRGAATPWHQDQAYHAPDQYYRGVNFWMSLDRASIDSGCLHFVPGSHKLDVLPHHPIGHDPRIHGLEVDNPAEWADKGAPCPVAAGGVTVHACYMLHYAAANTSDRPRRAYTLTFRCPPEKRATPVDNYWKREQRTARETRAARGS